MELLDFLRNNYGSLQLLETCYFIKVKRSEVYPNLVLLKYDQIKSDFNNPIVQQCRGIVVDEDDNWNVVCFTYSKFFNISEGLVAQLDYSTVKTYEKLDGSLMQLYYYNGSWLVASSGHPDAGGNVYNTNLTFNDLFWKTWNDLGYKLPLNEHYCYAFELCTPYNIIVVPHKNSRLVLHGVRRMSDLKEFAPDEFALKNGWECVKSFPLQTLDEIKEAANAIKACDGEGFVLCDGNFNRAKVKSLDYVRINHLREGFSTRRLLEIVRTNEAGEFLSHFPQYEKDYYEMKVKYEGLVNRIEGFYDAIKDLDDRKTFASKATTQKFSGVLFAVKFKSMGIRECLATMNIKALEEMLGIEFIDMGI